MERIFVYGSLREGMYNYDRYLKGHVLSNKVGYVKGELYAIKGVRYPALLEGKDRIVGEIIEVDDPSILQIIDELEEYFGEDDINNEYDKKFVDIYNEKDEKIDRLFVYFFNMRKESHKNSLDNRILHGDFIKYSKENV